MTLEMALPMEGGILDFLNKSRLESAGGISSLYNSWVHTTPFPSDTVSRPELGVSINEQNVTISFRAANDLSSIKWLNPTIIKMIQLLWLPTDWNSDSPKRIESRAIEKMLETLLVILDPNSTPPAVIPTTRGGVKVEWHQNGIDLEIEALNSGRVEYFINEPAGEKEGVLERNTAILKTYSHYLKTVAVNAA